LSWHGIWFEGQMQFFWCYTHHPPTVEVIRDICVHFVGLRRDRSPTFVWLHPWMMIPQWVMPNSVLGCIEVLGKLIQTAHLPPVSTRDTRSWPGHRNRLTEDWNMDAITDFVSDLANRRWTDGRSNRHQDVRNAVTGLLIHSPPLFPLILIYLLFLLANNLPPPLPNSTSPSQLRLPFDSLTPFSHPQSSVLHSNSWFLSNVS
jgi:hypothetical protein